MKVFLPSEELKEMDTKEFCLPETTCIHDIEGKLFQAIILQTIAKIDGVEVVGSSHLIDDILGSDKKINGIFIEQDQKKHSIHIRVEVNICFGLSVPERAEEIQMQIVKAVSSLTGTHVSCVHVIFKNIMESSPQPKMEQVQPANIDSEVYQGF